MFMNVNVSIFESLSLFVLHGKWDDSVRVSRSDLHERCVFVCEIHAHLVFFLASIFPLNWISTNQSDSGAIACLCQSPSKAVETGAGCTYLFVCWLGREQ